MSRIFERILNLFGIVKVTLPEPPRQRLVTLSVIMTNGHISKYVATLGEDFDQTPGDQFYEDLTTWYTKKVKQRYFEFFWGPHNNREVFDRERIVSINVKDTGPVNTPEAEIPEV